ncbi:CENPB protein Homeodomainlike [Phytophthora megakarya]|uniref:CENPB protein Homeodomainlike n=1 Tax=Phytophthora megakarya TaxID=4795 RepID=A0A225UJ07_9STRA|nr:CENPB protein Homeodomainlike [Phytophthora megakarya]
MTLEQKCEVIVKFHLTTPPPSLSELVRWAHTTFSLPNAPSRSTIMYILRKAKDIKCKLKISKTLTGHVLNLRSRLEKFIEETERDHVHPSRGLILEQAKDILMSIPNAPALKLSDGWMTGFLKRHDLRSRPLHDEAASVNPADIAEGRMAMHDVTRYFALRDVWNMDDTGLLYWATTTRVLCKLGTAGLKKDKTRITLALAANADGSEKRDVFFIGRAKKPYCFQGKEGWQLGYYYRNNVVKWINIFT